MTDWLDGTTFDGLTCDATLAIALERVTGLEPADVQAVACADERPPVCGDGVCEEGRESCAVCVEDCGCADGDECHGAGEEAYCVQTCTDMLGTGECADGLRCGTISDSAVFNVRDAEPGVCVPAGTQAAGEVCRTLNDCAEGLLCHQNGNNRAPELGICSVPCGETFTCDDGYLCQASLGGAWGCRKHCTMFDATSCPGLDQICYTVSGREAEATCLPWDPTAAQAGAGCASDGDCAGGALCFFGECHDLCDVTSDCEQGTCSVEGSLGFCA